MANFQAEQWVPYPIEQVFAFFSDPANLPRILPPGQRARIDQCCTASREARTGRTLARRFLITRGISIPLPTTVVAKDMGRSSS